MSIFDFEKDSPERIGVVENVDTANIVIKIENEEKLKRMQVNHLVVVQSSKVGQHLIALVNKIMRNSFESVDDDNKPMYIIENVVKATLIGTHLDKFGTKPNVFKRTLETVPEIDADCFMLHGDRLTSFMKAITQIAIEGKSPLSLGHYALDENAEAWLDGNKFFQRHAVIVGSTGSGKSWTVAKLLEQVAKLPSANVIVFDIHGEYAPLNGSGFQHVKIAGPNDKSKDGILFLPYWLLTYEEMISLMLDRSDNNAPNQAMAFSNAVLEQKRKNLESLGKKDIAGIFTIDSPVPYKLSEILVEFNRLDTEMVPGAKTEKQGPMHGKLTRFIQRLESKKSDKRLNFLFNESKEVLAYEYMEHLSKVLMHSSSLQLNKGVKIIDFSEVPSDVLSLMVSLVGRLVFSIQQWISKENRHPIAIFCDEAHLYLPEKTRSSLEDAGLQNFERIAKEGRKYGIGLVVISQRPAEVNRTILSQSNNFVAMRLTNAEDQAVIKRLLPDSLGGYAELLPILDIGEALVVGDASLLPSRIKISKPFYEPNSATVDFWDEWQRDSTIDVISGAIEALRKQSR
ncbi:AAA-like domain protein [Pelotomaculum schinkii]|uniref:AAA-like domain protein n=1 Tax=Pelotomaculum schinkii TaxID=78350 RepID=A0A4Y7RAA6_9FIRM|nr:ATP-binding protein [Pelotomaculum schinkii]TEB05591.1 AAA-like domain protein [Pelotomaculum schinkii]